MIPFPPTIIKGSLLDLYSVVNVFVSIFESNTDGEVVPKIKGVVEVMGYYFKSDLKFNVVNLLLNLAPLISFTIAVF